MKEDNTELSCAPRRLKEQFAWIVTEAAGPLAACLPLQIWLFNSLWQHIMALF